MMLTRAEALAEDAATLVDVPQEAYELLNEVRNRAITVTNDNGTAGNQALIEYTPDDFTYKQEPFDAILLERRVELSFEGHRMTDLQRRQMDVIGIQGDADILVFPIPLSQMDSNNNIEQNDGY